MANKIIIRKAITVVTSAVKEDEKGNIVEALRLCQLGVQYFLDAIKCDFIQY